MLLRTFGSSSADVRLELRHPKSKLRSATATSVLVAIVAGSSAAMSALITGLLKVLERKQSVDGKLVLRGANGASIEVPASTSDGRLQELIELTKSLDCSRITMRM
jgi:ABC-type Fe3+ transport system permease subunit